ncbi:MAG: sterol desaturase family protein [Gammaproteobacteria bacterium]|nr:sterol desaturase family protein [Gammaproteobacteria bacterium]
MTAEQIIDFVSGNYFVIVVSMFVLFMVAEMLLPMTRQQSPLGFRWLTNLGLTAINVLIIRLGAPAIAVVSALAAQYLGLGLFMQFELGLPLVLLLGLLIMDLKQYVFHWLMHRFDLLWRIHRVHHSDLDIDVTTGFRFHPLEAILNSLFNIVVIVFFGIAVEVILLRQLLVYFANFFSHSNLELPPRLDLYLKRVLVTPSMHHLHHALDKRAANSNLGTLFSFWDRMFGTYMGKHPEAAEAGGNAGLVYGLREHRDAGRLGFVPLMAMPFKSLAPDPGEVVPGRR